MCYFSFISHVRAALESQDGPEWRPCEKLCNWGLDPLGPRNGLLIYYLAQFMHVFFIPRRHHHHHHYVYR